MADATTPAPATTGTDLSVLPPRDPAFGPDALAGFVPQDPAAQVTMLNLNLLNVNEANAALQSVLDATKAKAAQTDAFQAFTLLINTVKGLGFF